MKPKKIIIAILIISFLIAFFFLAQKADPSYFNELGLSLPLPIFTFIIAIIDGLNPCTIWVLTFLLALLISVSDNRKKIFLVGFSFISVIFLFYFLFMAAWLNIFKFIGFIGPLRIAIAIIAIIAGLINCKDFFAFRKGITLMIQEKHKFVLIKKIENIKKVIKHGSYPSVISASVVLAAFASLVELPCTAGWPVIYTSVLSSKIFTNTFQYYSCLFFYNLIYIIPLFVIILLFGWFFKGKQINKEQMQIIKLVGGVIMLGLGIILLVNPGLLTLVN
ncbi:MAG: hypothetical protein U9P88_02545 [Patescibacteria group bacterium]|nr:hypothetical protein [Patescibacteria group bacterium]